MKTVQLILNESIENDELLNKDKWLASDGRVKTRQHARYLLFKFF